jgi:hypothetical protein
MDALKFLKECRRMRNSYEHCEGCSSKEANCAIIGIDSDEDYERVIAVVEQWSKEHPLKTRQSVFLEQWPGARMRTEGVLSICPATISPAYRGDDGGCSDISKGCAVCCREFWMQEVE